LRRRLVASPPLGTAAAEVGSSLMFTANRGRQSDVHADLPADPPPHRRRLPAGHRPPPRADEQPRVLLQLLPAGLGPRPRSTTMSQPDIRIPTDPLLNCPTCGLPAEITDRFILDGTPGPVEHVKIVCVKGHWYTPAVDQLPALDPEPGSPPNTASVARYSRAATHPQHDPGRTPAEYSPACEDGGETGGEDR
jgi:hypothetical protein